MTNPTPLSPAAQAVWEAFNQFDHAGMHVDYGIKMAAALRAAVDQVVPLTLEEELFCRNHSLSLQKMVEIRLQLLAIAAELEAQ